MVASFNILLIQLYLHLLLDSIILKLNIFNINIIAYFSNQYAYWIYLFFKWQSIFTSGLHNKLLKLDILNCNKLFDVSRYQREGDNGFMKIFCWEIFWGFFLFLFFIIVMCIEKDCVFGDILNFKVIKRIEE